jgi:SH3-like domain-containing protein
MSAPLDRRVTERGEPVAVTRLERGWLRIRRADGPAGVVLEVRIPGYRSDDLPCADQAAAREAAEGIYGDYRRAVEDLAS